MGEFGNQLVGFGGSMMRFAASIKGLDADAVNNAAIAGKAMAEMAATLPNTGGAVAFFAGDNDMSAFGDQLVPFGEAIKAYSDAVTGLDVDAVKNSAIAGQAMAELAATLPNTGGAVAFFAGDNDMATFGAQLASFGVSMKNYSKSVSGLDGDAVENSAIAGKTLVELANTIPNTGGLVAFFTGDNDLETFGDQLVPLWRGDEGLFRQRDRHGQRSRNRLRHCGEGPCGAASLAAQYWRRGGFLYRRQRPGDLRKRPSPLWRGHEGLCRRGERNGRGGRFRLYYRRPGPGRAPGISSPCGRGDELLYRGQRSWPCSQRGFSPSARP
mgnify:CR=1 FL=1